MYRNLARFYDAVHSAETDDIEFVCATAARMGGPVLDLGCGTGRLTIPMAQTGVYVVGIDNEAAMLDGARQKINELALNSFIDLVTADITHFELEQREFKLAAISQNTIMHFDSTTLRSALRSIGKHLDDSGMLLIDTANPVLMATVADQPNFVLEKRLQTEEDGEVLQYARWHNDADRQCIKVEWRYLLENGETISAETNYHYLYPHVLQMVMNQNGFSWGEVYGDYDKAAFSEDSERLIILAGKC